MSDRFEEMRDKVLDNRYKIGSKIGVGGMADVYQGQDLLLERTVAIKILHNSFAGDEGFVSRFKREAQAAGKLSHPNIVNMYDVGYDQGYHYIIMEFVPGETLKEYIVKNGKLSIENAVKIAVAIGEGLEHAHAMGIVHCDIKPHNILITSNGTIKVTDFGIARAMNSSQTMMYTTSVMGSAHYLSPEQASGKAVDGSTDIYSLGVVLYEMLTGRVPYQGDSAISVALKHVREKLTPPSRYNANIPPLLEAAVMKALEKEPSKRFQSVSEMISDLRLSFGFAGAKTSSRLAPYDFATQVLPTVKDNRPAREVLAEPEEIEKTGFLERLNAIPQKFIIIGAGVLFVLAFLWAFFSYGNFWSNATVKVPDVVGKQVTVAQKTLEDNHLRVTIDEVSNSEVAEGKVISTNPPAGSEVKEQRLIHVVVSKGSGNISMPDLKGLSLDSAKTTLNNLGLTLGTINTQESSTMPDNVIINQTPSAFSKVAKGTAISVTVSKKVDKKVNMPSLVGMTIKDAKATLSSLNLNVGQINGNSADDAVITNQTPAAGGSITEGADITLTGETKTTSNGAKSGDAGGGKTVSGTVDITVPAGANGQTVRIVLVDDNGRRVVYDSKQNPGDNIVRNVSGTGSVRVQVYINGALVQDQTL